MAWEWLLFWLCIVILCNGLCAMLLLSEFKFQIIISNWFANSRSHWHPLLLVLLMGISKRKLHAEQHILPWRPLTDLRHENDTFAWNKASFIAQKGGLGSGTPGILPWLRHWKRWKTCIFTWPLATYDVISRNHWNWESLYSCTCLKMRARDKRTATKNIRCWCFVV